MANFSYQLLETATTISVLLTTNVYALNQYLPETRADDVSSKTQTVCYQLFSELKTINEIGAFLALELESMKSKGILSAFNIRFYDDSISVKLVTTNSKNEEYLHNFFDDQPDIVNAKVVAYII